MLWRLILANVTSSGFTPADLFTGGENGGWYDPSDLSTLWKDDARTSQVTADGDTVAVMDDKSGNGNHLRQTTAANRPTYRTSGGLHWLEFDGSNDDMETNALSTTVLDSSNSGAYLGIAFDPDDANNGGERIFEEYQDSSKITGMYADTRTTPNRFYLHRPDGVSDSALDLDAELAADPVVLEMSHDATASGLIGYQDGVQMAGSIDADEAFGGTTYFLLGATIASTTLNFTGKVYGVIAVDRELTGSELTNSRSWLSGKAGL